MPCVTSDIYPTVLDLAGVKMEAQPPLDGISRLPIMKGEKGSRPRPIGFWHNPAGGLGVSAKQWMETLLAAQARGEEPTEPGPLAMDAGKIGSPVPLDRFPGHSAWLDWPLKLHRIENRQTRAVAWELYDLSTDPTEARVLRVEDTPRFPGMRVALETWLASVARSLNGEDYQSEGGRFQR